MEFLKNVKCGHLIKLKPQSNIWYEKGRKVKGSKDRYYIYWVNDWMQKITRATYHGYTIVFDQMPKPF